MTISDSPSVSVGTDDGASQREVIEGWFGFGMDLDSPSLRELDDPNALFSSIRAEAPVHRTPLGIWRLFRYSDVLRVLREVPAGVRLASGELPGRLGGGTPAGGFMLQQDPPTHTRLRKLVSKAFTPRATEAWRPRTEQIVEELLAPVLERGSLDVVADLALPVPAMVICEMMGVPIADRGRFTRWTAEATHALAGDLAPPEVREAAGSSALALAGYFASLIEERRKRLGDDLLSAMIRVEEEGDRLTADELLVQSIGLLIAGFETTIGLIANGLRQLILHPDELERLRRDPALIGSAVEECLRFDGPIMMTVRVLHADAEFGGQIIPRDSEVMAILASANRDPALFADPDRFDVAREPNPHLAFGGGAHLCLGAHLARMEAQSAIGALVARTRELSLESDGYEWGPSLFRVPARLPVQLRAA